MIDYKALREQALRYFRKKGNHNCWLGSHYDEDFAQFVLVAAISKPHRRLRHLYADFLRSHVGDTRNKNGTLKSEQRRRRYDEPLDGGPQAETSLELFNEDIESLQVTAIERCVLVLYSLWGFELAEIGHCLGLSEGRISQILKEIRQKNG